VVLGGFRGYVLNEEDRATGIAVRQRKARDRARDLAPVLAEVRKAGITSANGIARELTTRGIPTARGSTTWTAVQVQRLLADLE
jgi:hypothetical protein